MQLRRLYAYAVGGLVIGALLWPVSGLQKRDSFPLSTYPMFTRRRQRVVIYAVLGLGKSQDDVERVEAIPPRFIANNEVMQAVVTVRRAVRKGRAARRHFCQRVATAVAKAPDFSHVEALEIVRDIYDPLRYFAADGERIERQRLERCRIVR
ncbi:MAG: hypothetical protein V3U27_19495 [Candidatus Tectomicrobia bacterium]